MPSTRRRKKELYPAQCRDAILHHRNHCFSADRARGVVALPIILNHLPLPGVTGLLLEIARWPILLVLVAFGLTLIYRYGPSRTEPRWQWITSGSAFAAITWLAASALFSWYAANFGTFNKTYAGRRTAFPLRTKNRQQTKTTA